MKKILYLIPLLCLFAFKTSIAQPDWSVNTSEFQYTMTATGVIILNSTESTDVNDMVGAFVGDECRGAAQPVYIEALDRYVVFLMIFSNSASGETISFKVYNADQDAEHTLDFTADFVANKSLGEPSFPVGFASPSLSAEAELLDFAITGQDTDPLIDTDAHTITINLPFGTDVTNLIASFNISPKAIMTANGTEQESGVTGNDFSQTVIYTVTSENGFNSVDWLVTVNAANNEAEILSYAMSEQNHEVEIDQNERTIAVRVPDNVDITTLTAFFTLSENATAFVNSAEQTSGVTTNDFTNPVVYEIVAEDGTTLEWTVTVKVESAGAGLLSFTIPGQVGESLFDNELHTVKVNMPPDADLTNLIAVFEISPNSTITIDGTEQISSVTSNNFSETIVYTLTSEDGYTSVDWSVTVVAANNEADLLAFSISGQVGDTQINAEQHSIAINMPLNTDLTDLVAEFELSANAVLTIDGTEQSSGVTSNDFSEPLTYTVTAESGMTSVDWLVTVIAANNEAEIISYAIPQQNREVTIDANAHTIDVQVSQNVDVTNLSPFFTLSENAKVYVNSVEQVSGVTTNDFTNPVVYEVVAQDGTSIEWTVTVSVSTGIDDKQEMAFSVFPNPSNGNVFIHCDSDFRGATIKIFDMTGALLFEYAMNNARKALDLSQLSKGIYIIRMETEKQTYSQRISLY